MAETSSALRSDRTQVLETATARIHFSGGRPHNDSDSDSSSALSSSPIHGDWQRSVKVTESHEVPQNSDCVPECDEVTPKTHSVPECHSTTQSVDLISEDVNRSKSAGHCAETSGVICNTDSGCPGTPSTDQKHRNNISEDNNNSGTCDEDTPPDSSSLKQDIKQSQIDDGHDSQLTAKEPASRENMSLELNKNKQSPITTPVTSPVRFNPFNKEDLEEQDPFPQLCKSPSKDSDCDSVDSWLDDTDADKGHSADSGISNTELGMTEDYFAQPEGHIIVSSVDDLEEAIAECKQLVIDAPPESDLKKNLVHQLVQLRLKLAEAKEKPASPDEGIRSTIGHTFVMKDSHRSQRYCEQCNTVIWGVLQAWYRCNSCGFCCHEKCLDLVTRKCASIKVHECPEYILSICPEKTLASQNYKCAECRADISFHSSQREPRLCDYNGHWYCDRCHWNDQMILPARVLHNWDFEPKKVSRSTKQYLKLMRARAVLRVVDVNPMLFNFVEELNDVKKLREEVLVMKQYFLSCRGALQSKLLLQLKSRQHFVENSDMYSLHDLLDVANDVLLPELAKIHASFAQHIKTDCPHCQSKGNVCELCDEKEVLFPFDNIAIVCSQCATVIHRHCFMSRNQKCPKCTQAKITKCSTVKSILSNRVHFMNILNIGICCVAKDCHFCPLSVFESYLVDK